MRTRARTMAFGAAAFGATMLAAPALDAATDACKLAARAALRSCDQSAQSDRALALGRCANLADSTARRTCGQQASSDGRDALQTCRDSKGLRRSVCARIGHGPYAPAIDPASFVDPATGKPFPIDNPFFPLPPGTTYISEGKTEDGFEHDEFAVTPATRGILGVTCVEVHDTRQVDGKVVEDTRDWFAQDKDGNVWYFGENTTLVDGALPLVGGGLPVDLSGTWTGGVDGAVPGLVMEAHPAVGDFYRQEFLLGEAEDLAEVKSLSASAMIPFPPGTFDNCLMTEESSPLSPGDVESKFYAPGIGLLLTVEANGDRVALVQITTQ